MRLTLLQMNFILGASSMDRVSRVILASTAIQCYDRKTWCYESLLCYCKYIIDSQDQYEVALNPEESLSHTQENGQYQSKISALVRKIYRSRLLSVKPISLYSPYKYMSWRLLSC
jgi:hypothetical protein